MPTEREILLSGFLEADRTEFLDLGVEEEFMMHEVIVEDGAPASHMYIIEEGEVSVWSNGIRLADLKRGSIIGVIAMMFPTRRTASVRAEVSTRLIKFDRERLTEFFRRKSPRLFQQFFLNAFKILLGLIRRTNEQIVYLNGLLQRQL